MRNSSRWPRSAGRKPTPKEMKIVHERHLAQPGSKNAVVAAMLLRSEGVSQPQIIAAVGAPHRNKLKQLSQQLNVSVRKQGRVKVFAGQLG